MERFRLFTKYAGFVGKIGYVPHGQAFRVGIAALISILWQFIYQDHSQVWCSAINHKKMFQ